MFTKKQFLLLITIVYFIIFTYIPARDHNYEFLFYNLFFMIIIIISLIYNNKLKIPFEISLGFVIIIFLHSLGGNIYINEKPLYDAFLGPIKFDNFVHFISIFIVTFIVHEVFTLKLKTLNRKSTFYPLILLVVSVGIGAIHEIIELIAVLMFEQASPRVGDYLNNAFDLLFNLLGASAASIYITKKNIKFK